MSTFRILDDQENRVPEVGQKQAALGPAIQKRTVLGQLNNHLEPQQKTKAKQTLVTLRNNKENAKKVVKKASTTVVPVAQFEAFKVYEDGKEGECNARETIAADGIKGDKLEVLRKQQEVWDLKGKQQQCIPRATEEVADEKEEVVEEVKPMSVEKAPKTEIVPKSANDKDAFFENEEYRVEIYNYLREYEKLNRPKSGYMKKQPDITYSMRTILVDWLVEVAEEYKLQSETLFLAVNYIDRFLSYMSVVRSKLQLVGTAAMFIAAKYEEILPPDISEFVYITDDTYTKRQVIRMEHLILKVLSFDLSAPTPLTFISAMCVGSDMPQKVINLAMYMSELIMLDADTYMEMLPSLLAASAIAIARYTLNLEPWSAALKERTKYEFDDLKHSMEILYVLLCKAPSMAQQAVREKYKSSKYMSVALIQPRTGTSNGLK